MEPILPTSHEMGLLSHKERVEEKLLPDELTESEQQIELLKERQKAIAQIKASRDTKSNWTTQQLLDKPLSEVVEESGLLNAKDYEYFCHLSVWIHQLVQERQSLPSRYLNKKDYDDRMQSVNAKIEEIERYINNQPVSNATAKSVVEWCETLNSGEPIDWDYWLKLDNIKPEQAAKLVHMIDPILWPDDSYAAGGPYDVYPNGDKIDKELLIKIERLKQQLDHHSKEWSLVNLVSFIGEENAPFGMLEAVRGLAKPTSSGTAIPSNGKPRKKLKPFVRDCNQGLLLIQEMVKKYHVEYLNELPASKAWDLIVSGEFESEYIQKRPEHKNGHIELKDGDKLTKSDFTEKYRHRFE